jgi:hypothetical protein
MRDESSIARQLQRDAVFRPLYCPNPKCAHHKVGEGKFWRRYGVKELRRFPYFAHRFQCLECARTFTASFFRLDYRQKIWGLNQEIFTHHRTGLSKRESGRLLSIDEGTVRRRIIRISQFAMLKQAKLTENIMIEEPIVYDGLENFAFSQYDPNNINHAVGKKTLFTYDFNFAPLNRKGRMSPWQEKRKIALELKHGCYPKNAIRTSTARIFGRLLKKAKGESMVLYSDRHFQYRRAIEWDLETTKIEHIRTSSKIARNYRNHLFAVNNIDLQARHNLAPFKRETIAFSKHSIAMQESFMLYVAHRNFMRPKFWGTHRSDPECSKKSPAMELGIATKILRFEEFFSARVLPTQVKLHEDWENLYNRIEPTSRRPIQRVS